jgi:eukaryotic-like serine/threonine-protein kinase
MELVEGRSLAAVLREGPLPPRVAAGHARAIAQAMAAAHAARILHRDLKPSNILIDPFDQPRITDFGLAKRFVADPSSSGEASDRSTTVPADLTLTDQMLGSPNYLAPEVAAGPRSGIGPAADLFAIGAILYECLTGRPPFLAASLQETLLRIRDTDPVAPRLLDPKLPRDLETICLKCLEKEPSKRYPTAQALAEDLERFLNDEPILARPITRLERAVRWCRRKPALAASSLLPINTPVRG